MAREERDRPMYFPPSQWSARFGVQFFTVLIPDVRLFQDLGRKRSYAAYKITSCRGKQTITVWRRYSEFDMLQRHLQLYPSERIQRASLDAPLPGKTLFRRLKPEFLDRRREGLELYLQHIVSRDRRIIEVPIVRQFLQFDMFIEAPWWHPDPGEENPYGRQGPPEDFDAPDEKTGSAASPQATRRTPLLKSTMGLPYVPSEECLQTLATGTPSKRSKWMGAPRLTPPAIPELLDDTRDPADDAPSRSLTLESEPDVVAADTENSTPPKRHAPEDRTSLEEPEETRTPLSSTPKK